MSLKKFLAKGWGHTKLRVKLLVTILLLSSVALLGVSLLTVAALRSSMIENVDTQMIDTISSLTAQANSGVEVADSSAGTALALPGSFVIMQLNPDGTIRDSMRSVNLLRTLPDAEDIQGVTSTLKPSQPSTLESRAGQWRVVYQETNNGPLILAVSLSSITDTTDQFLRINLIISLTALLALTIAASFLLSRNLEPVHELEITARRISAGDLSQRVKLYDPRTEVGSLSAALNSMLSRLEEAFKEKTQSQEKALLSEEQMRRFTADVSHELRTPLTSIRGFSELAARQNPEDETYAKIGVEARRMSLLVDDLLTLARLDQNPTMTLREVDLVALTFDALDPLMELNPDRTIDIKVLSAVPHEVNVGAFTQVVTNLVANALHYTSGDVEVILRRTESESIIEVKDQGPGLSPEVASRVFERFFRAETSRSRNTGGSGLGLSIVSGLVEAHQGKVELETSPTSGSTFTIKLPR